MQVSKAQNVIFHLLQSMVGLLCMDNNNEIVFTGSSDHGLRVYNLSDGKQTKELFNKKYGHHEWVTSCQILQSRRIVSGGMDSLICVWEPTGVK